MRPTVKQIRDASFAYNYYEPKIAEVAVLLDRIAELESGLEKIQQTIAPHNSMVTDKTLDTIRQEIRTILGQIYTPGQIEAICVTEAAEKMKRYPDRREPQDYWNAIVEVAKRDKADYPEFFKYIIALSDLAMDGLMHRVMALLA